MSLAVPLAGSPRRVPIAVSCEGPFVRALGGCLSRCRRLQRASTGPKVGEVNSDSRNSDSRKAPRKGPSLSLQTAGRRGSTKLGPLAGPGSQGPLLGPSTGPSASALRKGTSLQAPSGPYLPSLVEGPLEAGTLYGAFCRAVWGVQGTNRQSAMGLHRRGGQRQGASPVPVRSLPRPLLFWGRAEAGRPSSKGPQKRPSGKRRLEKGPIEAWPLARCVPIRLLSIPRPCSGSEESGPGWTPADSGCDITLPRTRAVSERTPFGEVRIRSD
ncbi:hypothetical protein M885DRAFT_546435 [Pelagophyceae sp. CCMP2097]|nr:hypothetical protein M885DRAFT_546435 [Pelagophyceae sp. CCMP2097]